MNQLRDNNSGSFSHGLNDLRLAVLIDADNVPSSNIKAMMEEIARYGVPTFKRIYGDWTRPNLSGWKNVLLENAITPIQQYGYTKGKNATDSAMIIDAMDILYSGKVDGFCIVSSDSDFTRLATRLREAGMKVIGIGEKKTPMPFITSCDKFIYIEILGGQNTGSDSDTQKTESGKSTAANRKSKTKKSAGPKVEPDVIKLFRSSVSDVADENGWAFLGDVGNMIMKKLPSFDPRNYGYSKMTPLFKDLNQFEIDERQTDKSNTRHIFIRNKR
jgi:uncharacterized LabA/DUF88 family protein